MKICMFAKGLPVHVIGGLELHTQFLTEKLTERGHDVTVITTKHPKGLRSDNINGVKIYYVGDKSLKYTENFFKESYELFKRLNTDENFDVVHSQSTSGYGFVKYSKIEKPFVTTMHGIMKNEIASIMNEGGLKNWLVIPYLFFKYMTNIKKRDMCSLQASKKIISDSKELKNDLIKEYRIPEEKITIIYDGIDVNKFKPATVDDFRKKLRIEKDEKIILSSGRIVKQKGYHLIVQILPEILKEMKVRLIIVGDGDYLQHLKDLVRKRNISNNVLFTGKVSEQDLIKYYNLADVFVFPTLRVEAFGIVIAEAMSCGKPVVATKVGGIQTVVDDSENGYLIEMNNLKELKERLMMVFSNEKLAKKLGNAARKKVVENFSLEKMIDDTIKVYEEVANENRRKFL